MESNNNSSDESEDDESEESGLDKESKDQWIAICNESSEYKQFRRVKQKTKRKKTNYNRV